VLGREGSFPVENMTMTHLTRDGIMNLFHTMETHIKTSLEGLYSLPSPFPDETPLQSFIASYFFGKGI